MVSVRVCVYRLTGGCMWAAEISLTGEERRGIEGWDLKTVPQSTDSSLCRTWACMLGVGSAMQWT